MKLSKAQQLVVDKMREGYSLFLRIGIGWFLVEMGQLFRADTKTVRCLLKKGVLYEESKTECGLTEQYKTHIEK